MSEEKQIKFYMNNPCVIIRDINDDFCEIQLNTHFAVNIEAEYYCTPSECRSPMSSGEAAQEEYDQAQAILDDIQDEEHSIICMIEKRLLHDEPVEINSFKLMERQIKALNVEFEETKILHNEWQQSVKSHKNKIKSMKLEIESLNKTIETLNNEKEESSKGIVNLSKKYDTILCDIDKYSSKNKQITMREFNDLNKRDEILTALEHGGVDSWEWYEESLKNAGLIED